MSNAYEVLGNQEQKKLYDELRGVEKAFGKEQSNEAKFDQTTSYTRDERGSIRKETRFEYDARASNRQYKGGDRFREGHSDWAREQARASYQREQKQSEG